MAKSRKRSQKYWAPGVPPGQDPDSFHERVENAVDNAEPDFWAAIVKEFPEVKRGDLPPEIVHQLKQDLLHALQHWLYWNYPDQPFVKEYSREYGPFAE